MKSIKMLGAFAAGFVALTAVANDGLLFHADFNGSFKAVKAAGSADMKPSTETTAAERFAEGREGKGLLIGNKDGKEKFYVTVPAAKNIDAAQGSISFWVKPLDWTGKSKDFNMFVSANQAGNNNFYVYKYSDQNMGFCSINNKKSQLKVFNPWKWKTNEWHHLVYVWDKDTEKLYVDGNEEVTFKRNLSSNPVTLLRVGTRGWGVEKGMTVIDELKIYNRPLTEEDINKEFARF